MVRRSTVHGRPRAVRLRCGFRVIVLSRLCTVSLGTSLVCQCVSVVPSCRSLDFTMVRFSKWLWGVRAVRVASSEI